ncbi:hypothetical protein ISCGN_029701 [Ixodes scapularis]
MVQNAACDVHRWRLIHFPGILRCGRAVFYTVRKPSRRADELLREAPSTFFALLFLSIVACALGFCLINYCSGRQPLKGIQEVALVFVSTAMLFSYPIPQRFERVLAGRIMFFCWMVGGFSLATYLQSLLTSSLSSGYGWDADDTIDKLYPKLASGKVLPCVIRGKFLYHQLQSDNKQGIIGAMAAAQQRSPNKNSTLSDTIDGCRDKVLRGSHVFLSEDFEECSLAKLGNMVTAGKETIYTLYMSTPVRKHFPLRAIYGRLVTRIFETNLQSEEMKSMAASAGDAYRLPKAADVCRKPSRGPNLYGETNWDWAHTHDGTRSSKPSAHNTAFARALDIRFQASRERVAARHPRAGERGASFAAKEDPKAMGSRRDGVHVALPNDTCVDILFASGNMDNFLFRRRIGTVLRASYWCSSWSVYLKHLRDITADNSKRVAVITESLWKGNLSRLLPPDDLFSCWFILSEKMHLPYVRDRENPSQSIYYLRTSVNSLSILQRLVWNCTGSSYINLNEGSAAQEPSFSAAQTWQPLRNQSFVLGSVDPYNAIPEENIVVKYLELLGVNYRTIIVNSKHWITDVRKRRIDIMVQKAACDVHRWRLIHFPGILRCGRAVFYTVRKPSRRADELLREAPATFFALLFLSIVACALGFCLINYCSGRQPLKGIQEVALVFVSTAMLFSYPISQRLERVLAGRIVLFCWMVGGFSLATYLQSLLTSSLSTRYGWDADDTIDKLYPKLASGKVLPCVIRGKFLYHQLQSDNKQGIIGAMAAAQQRSPNKNSTLSDTIDGCRDKVLRGSHVLLSLDLEECRLAMLGNMVTAGKETIYTLYLTTPVRKHFPLRAIYGRLVTRIFETNLQFEEMKRFGHGARSCRGKNICAKCGSTDHVADICENEVKCAKCDGEHPAYARACPIWKQEKEILSLRAKDNLSYPEAKKRDAFLAKGGFVEVVRRGLAPPSEPRPFQVPSGNREAVAQPPPTKKPEVAACPSPQRGGTGAPPTQRDRLSNDMPALITRSPPRRKERAPRPKPPEEPSTSKEQQALPAGSTVSPEEERMDVSESPPIRLAPPDDSKLKKSSQKKPIPRVIPPKPPEGV